MNSKSFIFLDIDGVLNNRKHFKKMHDKYGGRFFAESMPFNPRSLKNLKRIVDATNSEIVLTSTWRKDKDCMTVLKARLKEYGLNIYSTVDSDDSMSRSTQISLWLIEHYGHMYYYSDDIGHNIRFKIKCKYIIIDDQIYDLRKCFDRDHIVKTNYFDGLTYLKTLEAIGKLKRRQKI